MDISIGISQEQKLRVSPSLIISNEILQLSSAELQEEIRRELEANPALEMDDRQICPVCGSAYQGSMCLRCGNDKLNINMDSSGLGINKSTSDDYSGDSFNSADSWSGGSSSFKGDDEFDPMTIVASEMSLNERILADLSPSLPEEDMPIAEFLVGSLDERGYLSTSVEAVAEFFNTDEEKVIQILQELQQVAPTGVGARNLQECLLLQMNYLEEPGLAVPHVREILEKHFDLLGAHRNTQIAQHMGISSEEVNQAREFIKKNLNPFPASGQAGELNGVRYAGSMPGHVMPDVIISERDGEFQVEVIESKRYFLKINPLYVSLANSTPGTETSDADSEHVRRYVNRAKTFLANINQRRETMLRITQALVEIQQEFLRNGVRDLRPLTRSTLASYLGIHESTVSRATAGKYVMLPNRKVMPFSDFFTASLSIKDVIKEIIEREKNKGTNGRLTDQDIVEQLANQGIQVARRTVAKYRSQLKILPSTLR